MHPPGDILSPASPKKCDLLFGLDVFEHLNPNKLDAYLARLAAVTSDDAFLYCNTPAFGDDPVFGPVFPRYVDGWKADAAAGQPFARLHTDEAGSPIHGHLVWADAAWWSAQCAGRLHARARDRARLSIASTTGT